MAKKDTMSPLASLVPILQGAAGLAMAGYAWSVFEPSSFQSAVSTLVHPLLAAGAGSAAICFGVWWRPKRPARPSWEDWACGHYITGLPGSGKTALAYLLVREFCEKGWGWIWLSIKSSLSLLQFLPDEARDRCILFAPYSDHP